MKVFCKVEFGGGWSESRRVVSEWWMSSYYYANLIYLNHAGARNEASKRDPADRFIHSTPTSQSLNLQRINVYRRVSDPSFHQ